MKLFSYFNPNHNTSVYVDASRIVTWTVKPRADGAEFFVHLDGGASLHGISFVVAAADVEATQEQLIKLIVEE